MRFRACNCCSRLPNTKTPGSRRKRRRTETALRLHIVATSCTVRNLSLVAAPGEVRVPIFAPLRGAHTQPARFLYTKSAQPQSELGRMTENSRVRYVYDKHRSAVLLELAELRGISNLWHLSASLGFESHPHRQTSAGCVENPQQHPFPQCFHRRYETLQVAPVRRQHGANFILIGTSPTTTDDTRFLIDFTSPTLTAPAGVAIAFDNFKVNDGSISVWATAGERWLQPLPYRMDRPIEQPARVCSPGDGCRNVSRGGPPSPACEIRP